MLVDQRDGTMLHFRSRITLGMNVGNLFEFQRSFQRDREIVLSPEEEKVLSLDVLKRHSFDIFVSGKNALDLSGH